MGGVCLFRDDPDRVPTRSCRTQYRFGIRPEDERVKTGISEILENRSAFVHISSGRSHVSSRYERAIRKGDRL